MYLLAFLTPFPLQAPAPCPSGLEHLSYKVWKCKWFHFQGHHTARFSLTPSHAAVIWRTSRLNCFDVWSRWSLPLSLSLSDDATSPHSLPNGANQCPDFRTVSSVPFLGFSSLLVYVRACFFLSFFLFSIFLLLFFFTPAWDSNALPRSTRRQQTGQTNLTELFITSAWMSTWQNLQLWLLCGEKWE